MSKIHDYGLKAVAGLAIFATGFGISVRDSCANSRVTDALGGQVVTGPSEEMCLIADLAFFGGILVMVLIVAYKGVQWYKKRQNP